MGIIRLAMIFAGVIVIRYGYRLFATGVFKIPPGPKSELSGRYGDFELKFKTASPGAILILFGAGIIVAAIASAPPEFDQRQKVKIESGGTTGMTVETSQRMRGKDIVLSQLMEEAGKYKEKGETGKAISTYQEIIRQVSGPIHELALLYKETNRIENARALAEVLVMMNPSDHDFDKTREDIKRQMEKNK